MFFVFRFFVLSCLCFGTVSTVFAYNPIINQTIIPYEVSIMDSNIETEAEYLGELIGYPQMYEFVIGADRNLTLQLKQLDNETPVPFSLIVVKDNNSAGVSEIGRLRAPDAEWLKTRDKVLGLTFLQSKLYSVDLGTGIYRVEVSTPENFGKYLLLVGSEPNSEGYFNTLADIRTVQKFFDKGIFSMFKSTYVYYPFGILVIIILFLLTRRYQTEIQAKLARKN